MNKEESMRKKGENNVKFVGNSCGSA